MRTARRSGRPGGSPPAPPRDRHPPKDQAHPRADLPPVVNRITDGENVGEIRTDHILLLDLIYSYINRK